MRLKDTAELMLSQDPKDRFKAEYFQLCERMNLLWKFLKKVGEGKIEGIDAERHKRAKKQLSAMKYYKKILVERAKDLGMDPKKDLKE